MGAVADSLRLSVDHQKEPPAKRALSSFDSAIHGDCILKIFSFLSPKYLGISAAVSALAVFEDPTSFDNCAGVFPMENNIRKRYFVEDSMRIHVGREAKYASGTLD